MKVVGLQRRKLLNQGEIMRDSFMKEAESEDLKFSDRKMNQGMACGEVMTNKTDSPDRRGRIILRNHDTS